MDFSFRLKKLRGGRTQGEFAEFLGIGSQQTYANYEKGRVPKQRVLQQISQRTGVSVGWLLNGEGAMKPEHPPPPTPSPQAVGGMDYNAVFSKLLETADVDWLLCRMDTLAQAAAQGDTVAAATVTAMMPAIRSRLQPKPPTPML